jgi:Domain of unknown function (DUF4260)
MNLTQPKFLMHLEGGVLLVMALFLYGWTGGNWWLFALLLLAPDLAMVGYMKDAKLGAVIYNFFHIYLWPALLGVIGLWSGNALLIQLGLIWLAHIGMDRMLGYGLKYPTEFKDTHFSRV